MLLGPPLLAFLSPNMQTAFTPIWLLSLGALAGLLLLGLLCGVWFGLNRLGLIRQSAREGLTTAVEGPLLPMLVIAAILSVLGLVGFTLLREPGRILNSLFRLGQVKNFEQTYTIADLPAPDPKIHVFAPGTQPADKVIEFSPPLRRSEMSRLILQATGGTLIVTARPDNDNMALFRLPTSAENGEYVWNRNEQSTLIVHFPEERIERLYLRGVPGGATQLKILAINNVPFPEVAAIPVTALSLVGIVLIYFLQHLFFPKIAAVALATAKSEMAQPVFLFVAIAGSAVLLIFAMLPYNTFGEDIKMLKMTGLDIIKVLGIIVALWAAGSSVADEIEGRTALTLLSKPIRRHEFILGKMSGIAWTSLALFVILGTWFLVLVSYRTVIDARESAKEAPHWQIVFAEVARTVPGLFLHFLETVLFGALGVAISTRLPMVANFVICITVYMLGHLTPLLVQSSAIQLPWVEFIARLIATVFPVLEYFDVNAAIAQGVDINISYLLTALLYCALYSAAAILLALILFEDRDLA
jgi:ABC-type transport system involved in multi-copper enzyme maturation permease subunit